MKYSIVEDVLKYLRECGSFRNNCDCLLDNNECDYLLNYIEELEQRLKHTRSILDKSTKQRDDKIETYEIAFRLQKDYIEQLEANRNEAIELLTKGITFCENDSQGNYDICNIAIGREKKAIEILERGQK